MLNAALNSKVIKIDVWTCILYSVSRNQQIHVFSNWLLALSNTNEYNKLNILLLKFQKMKCWSYNIMVKHGNCFVIAFSKTCFKLFKVMSAKRGKRNKNRKETRKRNLILFKAKLCLKSNLNLNQQKKMNHVRKTVFD